MKRITTYFSRDALAELQARLGVTLEDERDYSAEELGELYIKVTDGFPYEFDREGEPLRMGLIFEEIIDVLIKLGATETCP